MFIVDCLLKSSLSPVTPVGNDDDDPLLSPTTTSAARPLAARRTLIKADNSQSPNPSGNEDNIKEADDASKEFATPSASSSSSTAVKGIFSSLYVYCRRYKNVY